jgi:predicted transcriptional regulator
MNKNGIERRSREILFLLYQKERLSLNQICRLMDEEKLQVMLSLGTLIKEGKVFVCESDDDIIIETTYTFSNVYY